MVKKIETNSTISKWDAHLINNAEEIEKEFQESRKAWIEGGKKFDEEVEGYY